jgi:hypothetical protein
MSSEEKRVILQQLALGTISMDEAEDQLARIDDPEPDGSNPAVSDPSVSEPALARPAATRVLPASYPDGPPAVHIELDSSADIEILGSADADEPYLDGPHSAGVHENGGGFQIDGRMGDDGLLVIPADADITVEANGRSFSLAGTRGSLGAELNVGHADIRAAFTRGESSINANVGKLHIGVHPDSNVRIQILSATSIRVSDDLVKTGRGLWTYGNGAAALQISGEIGRVTVNVDVDVDVDADVEIDEHSIGADLADVSAT